MSTNHTSNYNLCQWEADDKVLRTDFNEDNRKIDAALKSLSSSVSGKASSSALSSLQTAVNGKADASTVSALQTTVNGLKTSKADKTALDSLKATVTQHTAALSGKGNCQVVTTSYAGTGRYGSESISSLTFDKKPMVIFICYNNTRLVLVQGCQASFADGLNGKIGHVGVDWTDNTVQWAGVSAAAQMNENTRTYIVVAILQAD